MTECFHCGEPIPANFHATVLIDQIEQPMCCVGCQAIAQTIVDNQLTDYYKFRTEVAQKAIPLVPEQLQKQALLDQQALQQQFTYTEGDISETILSIDGISCAACAWLIEMQLMQLSGVVSIQVNATSQRATVKWQHKQCKLSDILATIQHIGYQATPFKADEQAQTQQQQNKTFIKRLGISGILMMQVMMIAVGMYFGAFSGMESHNQQYLRWVSMIVTVPIVAYGALPFYQGAYTALKARTLSMDVPIALAIILAFSASCIATITESGEVYFESVAMFTFLLLVGKYLEFRARTRAANLAANLLKMMPITAAKISDNDQIQYIAASELVANDYVIVKPGEVIPADGVIFQGSSQINEAMLSGEPKPVNKTIDDHVFAGTINGDGHLTIKVLHDNQQSFLFQLIRLSEQSQHHKPKIARISDRIAQIFVGAILLVSALTALYWWQVDPNHAFWITIAVLVATCPCALSLATPTALTCSTIQLNKLGVIVKTADAIETLTEVDTCAFDKTGTLTEGNFSISHIEWLSSPVADILDETTLLDYVAALEQHSEHPIAKAFQPYHRSQIKVSDINITAGIGIAGKVNEFSIRVGKPSWFSLPLTPAQQQANCLIEINQQPVALIYLTDAIRDDAELLIRQLHQSHIQTILLSGDNQSQCQQVAETLQLQHYESGLSAEQKLQHLKTLQQQHIVAMVGDGVNDSPVLAQAHVSIAMGAGTEIAKNGADIILLNNRLINIAHLFQCARKTKRIIKQNYVWAFLYNIVVLPLAVTGVLSPYMAVIGMSASSIIVVTNSLRLLKK